MSALDRILAHPDPSGRALLLLLALVAAAIAMAYVGALVRFAVIGSRAALQGRRERLERERRRAAARATRPGPNWLAADLRRRREGVQS